MKPAIGPISPELVLVDPDLAAGARAALPDYPWPAPVRIEPREPTRHRGEPTRHRRIPVAATFSFLSFAALVGILGVSLLPTRDQPTFAAEGQRTLPAAPSTTTGVSPHACRSVSYDRGKPAACRAPEQESAHEEGQGRRTENSGAKTGTVGKARVATVQTRADVRLGASGACGLLPGCPFSKRPALLPDTDPCLAADSPTPYSVHGRRLPLDGQACAPGPERHAPRGSNSRLHVQNRP